MSARFVDEREIVRNKSFDFSTEKVIHALSPHYSIRSLPSFVHYISNCRVTNFRNRIERGIISRDRPRTDGWFRLLHIYVCRSLRKFNRIINYRVRFVYFLRDAQFHARYTNGFSPQIFSKLHAFVHYLVEIPSFKI